MRINLLVFALISTLLLYVGVGYSSSRYQIVKPVAQSVRYATPYVFDNDSRKAWVELGNAIVRSDKKVIYLEIQGIGGFTKYLDDFLLQVDKAKRQGKTIIGVITGPAISCHALLVCFMDKVVYSNTRAYLYFHVPALANSDGTFLGYITDTTDLEQIATYFTQCQEKGVIDTDQSLAVQIQHKVVIVRKNNSYIKEEDKR